MCIILEYIHIGVPAMKASLKVRKQFILDPKKIKQAQRILKAKTETETIEKALDDLLAGKRIAERLKKMAGRFSLENMDQSTFLE